MDLSGPSRGAAGLDFRKSSQQAVELKENLRAVRDTQSFAKALKSPPLVGLDAMFTIYQRDEELRSFFPHTLPFIVEKAGELPKYFPSTPSLKRLEQNCPEYQALDRGLVLSLMAQMFLCLLDAPDRAMPACSFEQLLCPRRPFPQEVAKLRMFVHYLERCRLEPPKGELRIWRQVRTEKASTAAWKASKKPLLPMQVADRGVGLEDEMGRGCLHADFANMYLGGGVLVGGCVQEEIRFAICPELCAAMVICPYMLDHEAITIVGGEQFSAYSGYGRSLAYAGDFRDPTPKDEDGTVLVAITAMDALDFRGQEVSLSQQLRDQLLLRELEKAAIAFAPTDEAALRRWPVIATGNWGCGAFGGCVELKAILQWLAASEASRQLLYFPYDVPLGPALSELADTLTRQGATVGSLFTALTSEPTARRSQDLFEHLRERLAMHGG